MKCDPVGNDERDERFYVMAMPELTIYGHTIDRWTEDVYPEDWQHTISLRKRGIEWGCWHSVACVDGEIGSNEIRVLRPIEFEAFAFAREEGWPYVRDYTTLAPVAAVGYMDDSGKFVWDWSSLDDTLGQRNQG